MFGKKSYEFVAIGDTVIDAFIKLKEAHINCRLDNAGCEICMKYGEKIPFESVEICNAVGNSANAAVAASRLGIDSALITNLGDDQNGSDCLAQLKKENVGTSLIERHKGMKTNYHYVLWYEADRTILIKHEEYPYKFPDFKAPKWLYLSSLGNTTFNYHKEIIRYLEKNSDVKLVFQPGTFQIRFGKEELAEIYKRAEIFFCNKEEAQKILGNEENNIKLLMMQMRELGPKIVVLTDGPSGAYVYDGKKAYFMPPYPDPKPPYDRTGAGDAYASTFTGAMVLGKSIEEALQWAGINSMSVVQQVGAQKGLLNQKQIEEFLAMAPEDYKVKEI